MSPAALWVYVVVQLERSPAAIAAPMAPPIIKPLIAFAQLAGMPQPVKRPVKNAAAFFASSFLLLVLMVWIVWNFCG